MFIKLDFTLLCFHIMRLDLTLFRQEILTLFNEDKKYIFNINSVYYLHLLDPYGHVLITIPFELKDLSDKEDLIEDLYNNLSPYLENFLLKYGRYNPYFFIFYIGSKTRTYISYKEMFYIKKTIEV